MFAILKNKKQCSLWIFFQDKLKMKQGEKIYFMSSVNGQWQKPHAMFVSQHFLTYFS
jgi:hypothetical protein